MSKEVGFISVEYIKSNSIVSKNIDNDIIEPFIISSQDKYIERAIGTKLFRKLEDDISASTVTGIYKTILDDYVAKCLKEFVIYEAFPFLNYKVTNKSVMRKEGDNSTSSELDELIYLRNGILDTANYYLERLKAYLYENQSSLPEFPEQDSGIDKLYPKNRRIYHGIYLKGDNCQFNKR